MSSNTLLPIKDVLSQAWHKVKGVKGKIWLGYLMVGIFTSIINVLTSFIFPLQDKHPSIIGQVTSVGLGLLVTAPLMAWILTTLVKQARQEPIAYDTMFTYFNPRDWARSAITLVMCLLPSMLLFALFAFVILSLSVPLLMLTDDPRLTPLLALTIASIACLLISIPVIIINIMTFYALPCLIEKNLSPWQAICHSYQLTKGYRWKVFTIVLIPVLLVILLCMPISLSISHYTSQSVPHLSLYASLYLFFITLTSIWIYPWMGMVYGEIYHRLTQVTRTNIE